MKKKIFLLLLVCCVTVITCILLNNHNKDNVCRTYAMNNETNSVFSNFEVDEQDEANVAHQNLIASFEGNSKGLLYPK